MRSGQISIFLAGFLEAIMRQHAHITPLPIRGTYLGLRRSEIGKYMPRIGYRSRWKSPPALPLLPYIKPRESLCSSNKHGETRGLRGQKNPRLTQNPLGSWGAALLDDPRQGNTCKHAYQQGFLAMVILRYHTLPRHAQQLSPRSPTPSLEMQKN